MKKLILSFGKNIKSYIDYIMTLGFKDLFRHFISLVVVVLISLLIYVPVGLIKDIIFDTIGMLMLNAPVLLYNIIGIVFDVISLISALILFMYMFNRRYNEVYTEEISKSKDVKVNNQVTEEVVNKEVENIELPKEK